MKTFKCRCGQPVFFDNTWCTVCGAKLGFDPNRLDLISFDILESGEWQSSNLFHFKPCKNYSEFEVCNWVLPFHSADSYCLACSMNEMIPAVSVQEKRHWWQRMESAKRRLLFSLLALRLPVVSRQQDGSGLAFAFLEDKRMNPHVEEEFVATGYQSGLITVNVAEADDLSRETSRVLMEEPYRTLLGHFRHESGHYYFDKLVRYSDKLANFRQLFGNEQMDYNTALDDYYQNHAEFKQRYTTQANRYISCYAQSHPLEDWAECWSHYLHMIDTLETAAEFGIIASPLQRNDFYSWIGQWQNVTVAMNALNRSMGLRDAYPFVLSQEILAKIHYVHLVIDPK